VARRFGRRVSVFLYTQDGRSVLHGSWEDVVLLVKLHLDLHGCCQTIGNISDGEGVLRQSRVMLRLLTINFCRTHWTNPTVGQCKEPRPSTDCPTRVSFLARFRSLTCTAAIPPPHRYSWLVRIPASRATLKQPRPAPTPPQQNRGEGGASLPLRTSDQRELSCNKRLGIAFGGAAFHAAKSCQAKKGLPIEPLLGALAREMRNQ